MQSGHAEFGQGYHQGPYGYTTQALSSVASNSGHDINKPIATAQQGMYSYAGMPAPAQHHQSMGGPIASPQPIIQQGQQMSRNQITMQTASAYFPRNSGPPRSMQNIARNPTGTVVNQPVQQTSQYGPMPTMVPLQPNFTSFPPTMVNPQFSQMYQQRAYNHPQFPIMASQQYLWNYNTPPPLNTNGYFPSHGLSSCQSIPPQMPLQTIPQNIRKGAPCIPIIDPKTGRNVLSAEKNAEDSSSRSNSEKESENSDSNICVQFATQVAAVLNDSRSEMASKQPEPVRIDTMCSHENEGMRVQETPVGELVDENINELQNIENLSEVEITDIKNLICNEEIAGPYYSKDIDSKSINESESGATKIVDSEINIDDREQIVFEVPVESSVPAIDESIKSEKLNLNYTSNAEKMAGYNETKKRNNVKSVKEADYSISTQELVQPVVTYVKEEILNNKEVLESTSAVGTKIPEKVLNEGKTQKIKDLNKRGESDREIDSLLDLKKSPTNINQKTRMSIKEMKENLLRLLEKNSELEKAFDWINACVLDTSDPSFICALVTAVHEICFSGSGSTREFNTVKLKSRIPLLSRYVSSNEKLQLQALYAVQALSNQLGQPNGLLHQIFDILYDEEVVSDESLIEWEKSDDTNQAEKACIIK